MANITKAAGMEMESPLFRSNLFNINPFGLMRQFTEEMDRVFGGTEVNGKAGTWMPAIEVKSTNGNLVVSAELPGLKKDDVKVTITENQLSLEGERKQEKEEKGEGYVRTERSYGKFYRAITLPEGAKGDQAVAKFNDGVLEITIPAPEAKKAARQIPIQEAAKPAK